MNEIKLEVGQIWTGKDEHVRQIIFIGNTKVFYSILTSGSHENVLYIEYFKYECTRKLLPCWPEKKVKRAQALFAGDSWPYSPRHWFKDEDDARKYTDSKILEFPLNGIWKEFDE